MANFPPRSTARPFGSKIKPVHGKGWADKPTPLGFVGTFLSLWLAVGLPFWAGGLVSERLEDWWVGVWADTPVRHETGADRRVIARGHGWRSNRCDIAVRVNGVPAIFMVDSGAPSFAEFPNSYVKKLNSIPAITRNFGRGRATGKSPMRLCAKSGSAMSCGTTLKRGFTKIGASASATINTRSSGWPPCGVTVWGLTGWRHLRADAAGG